MSISHPVLNELLDPVGACLTREVAERIHRLRAPAAVQQRIEELASRSEGGTLTEEEGAEYEALVSAGTFIAVLQTKARQILKNGAPSQDG